MTVAAHRGVAIILTVIGVMLMSSSGRGDAEIVLPPCASAPNCVSSMANDSHRIKPLPLRGDARASFDRLRTVLASRSDTAIIAADKAQIRVEFRTLLGFVDDGLFVLDVQNGLIQVRSAARVGYWDFGKNRRRLEDIREEYNKSETE